MEYIEVRQIIEEMEKDGWTINNADIHFLKRYSEYVLRKHAVMCEFHCERFDFGRDKKCEQQCSDCHWMQTKPQ